MKKLRNVLLVLFLAACSSNRAISQTILVAVTPSPDEVPIFIPTPVSNLFGNRSGKITFYSLDHETNVAQIYKINEDGSGLVKLVNGVDPVWSPDGTKIAFRSLYSLSDDDILISDLFVIDVDGPSAKFINAKRYRGPFDLSWSPDGAKIAFMLNYDIYVMNADGSEQINLTNNRAKDLTPAWAPDGTKIAFSSDRSGSNNIYVMNADGSQEMRLTYNSEDDILPVWSPDGKQIAFNLSYPGNYEIYAMNADGSGQTRLTDNGYLPVWSPDSTKIAFMSSRDEDNEIYAMNADGSEQTRLTNSNAKDSDPVWSPDGTKIAFLSRRAGNEEIYVMSADGSNVTRLTNSDSDEEYLVWSP